MQVAGGRGGLDQDARVAFVFRKGAEDSITLAGVDAALVGQDDFIF